METPEDWPRHKWRRDTGWWDDLEVPMEEVKTHYDNVFAWLQEKAPSPLEHDYILYTDGSGCDRGWGGYAALIQRIDLDGETRRIVDSRTIVNGTYGSTVQRCEMSAFMDGIHSILVECSDRIKESAKANPAELFEIANKGGAINCLDGPDRPTVLWYNDRSNVAQALLFDDEGNPLFQRKKDRDLWLRWSMMARHVCVTPMCTPRNTVPGQAVCDALAGHARQLMKENSESFAELTKTFQPTETWNQKKSQKAPF